MGIAEAIFVFTFFFTVKTIKLLLSQLHLPGPAVLYPQVTLYNPVQNGTDICGYIGETY
jgi:hypothetical protein